MIIVMEQFKLYQLKKMKSHERYKQLLPFGGNIHCIDRFLSSDNSQELMNKLMFEIPWEKKSINIDGELKELDRETCWFSEIKSPYFYSDMRNDPVDFTPTLLELKYRVEEFLGIHFNSILANLYRNQESSIQWHADTEKALIPESPVASLSFGATRTFRIKHKKNKFKRQIFKRLKAGDLLVLDSESQQQWLHAIARESGVKSARINLTFRNVWPLIS